MHIPSVYFHKLLMHHQQVANHTLNVVYITSIMVQEMDLYSCEYQALPTAALLHDIAKTEWQTNWFYLPKKMIPQKEWEVMQRHPEISADIAYKMGASEIVCNLIRNHHTKTNSVADAILRAADIYVACREARPYRCRPLTPKEALAEVQKSVPNLVSRALVDALNKNKEVIPYAN